jgi:heptosyltransferase I
MVPVIRTLQNAWPACKITWIIGRLEAGLVGDLPGVEFIIFDKAKGWRAFGELRTVLKNRHFDVLLHMQVATRASLISLFVKAPLKLGFDKARAHDRQWLFTNQRIAPKPNQHVLDGFFGFMEALGIHQRQLRWDIPIPETAARFADRHLPADVPLLVINPCTSQRARNWRNWPTERYAAVADYAHEEHGMLTALTGGPNPRERQMAEGIIEQAGHPLIDLVGRTSPKEMLTVLQRADIAISPDTGPAHMATAVGTPVIGLYATSNPLRTGPYLSQHYVVNKYPEALRKYSGKTVETAKWGERVRHPAAMELISVDDVKAMLDKVIADIKNKKN